MFGNGWRRVEDFDCAMRTVRITLAAPSNHAHRMAGLMEIGSACHRHPQIMGGTPVFVGTRVPVRTLFDYLAAGSCLDEFLEDFPGVSRQKAVAVLQHAAAMLLREVPRAQSDE